MTSEIKLPKAGDWTAEVIYWTPEIKLSKENTRKLESKTQTKNA